MLWLILSQEGNGCRMSAVRRQTSDVGCQTLASYQKLVESGT